MSYYVYREGARVTWGYVNRILGQPSLIRESSIGKFPWSGMMSQAKNIVSRYTTAAGPADGKKAFENVVLHPSLKRRIEHLARATANTRTHQAPFRNMLFYGPPGTGKTMVAKEIARKSVWCLFIVLFHIFFVFFFSLKKNVSYQLQYELSNFWQREHCLLS